MKTVGIALFAAVVTAASVVWYIDHKINQMTEAVMAPVHETAATVSDTITGVQSAVDQAVTNVEGAGDDLAASVDRSIDAARSQITTGIEQGRADLAVEVDNARAVADRVGDWAAAVGF